MIISLSQIKNLNISRKNISLSCFTTCLVFLGAIVGYPFLSSITIESRRPFVGIQDLSSHIVDERGHYYWIFGLFSPKRDSWPTIASQPEQPPRKFKSTCGILGGKALHNPFVNLIDLCDYLTH